MATACRQCESVRSRCRHSFSLVLLILAAYTSLIIYMNVTYTSNSVNFRLHLKMFQSVSSVVDLENTIMASQGQQEDSTARNLSSSALVYEQQQQLTQTDVLHEQQQPVVQLLQQQQLQQLPVAQLQHHELQQLQPLPVVVLQQQVVELEQPHQPVVLQQDLQQQQPIVEQEQQQQQQQVQAMASPSPQDGVSKIIVAAYYRSGSTFVSDLLQLGNNSFYLFEPFYAIYAHWYGTVGYHEVLFTGEGRERQLPGNEAEMLVSMTADMLDCRFSALPPEFFFSIFLYRFPPSLSSSYVSCLEAANVSRFAHQACVPPRNYICTSRAFLSSDMAQFCYGSKQAATSGMPDDAAAAAARPGGFGGPYLHLPPVTMSLVRQRMKQYADCVTSVYERIEHCIPILTSECQTAKVRVVKTIRHTLDMIDKVVDRVPDTKVVHLVRDPRAMLVSRQKWVRTNNKEVAATCARLEADRVAFNRLVSAKPRTYFQLRFEDLVMRPLAAATDVHRHAGLTLQEDYVMEWVSNHTSAQADNSPEGTVRQNSTSHASQWRQNVMVTGLFSRYAPRECLDTIRQFKYDV